MICRSVTLPALCALLILAAAGLLRAEPVVIIDGVPIDSRVIARGMKQYAGVLTKEDYKEKQTAYVIDTIKLFLKRRFSQTLKNITVPEEEIDRSLEEIRKEIRNDPELRGTSFEEILAFQGLSLAELRERQRDNLRYAKYLESLVTGEECRALHEATPGYFDGTAVRFSQIVFKTAFRTEDEQAAARTRAEQMLEALRTPEGPEAFGRLAEKFSEDPSSTMQGDMGFVHRIGEVDELLAERAFSMEVGEISDIITTSTGYHILKVTDRRKGIRTTYEECRATVRNYLLFLKENELIRRLMQEADVVFPGQAPLPGTSPPSAHQPPASELKSPAEE